MKTRRFIETIREQVKFKHRIDEVNQDTRIRISKIAKINDTWDGSRWINIPINPEDAYTAIKSIAEEFFGDGLISVEQSSRKSFGGVVETVIVVIVRGGR